MVIILAVLVPYTQCMMHMPVVAALVWREFLKDVKCSSQQRNIKLYKSEL